MQTNPQRRTHATTDTSIEKLQQCLRSEVSAMETYELALKNITHVGLHRALQEIYESHARRSERLRETIVRAGGDPVHSSGLWGAFLVAVQAGADLLGDRAALAALEEGEDRGLRLYTVGLGVCDTKTRRFVDTELLTEQRRTHELCRKLKEYVNAPS